jgi:hypothetical protein
MRAMYTAWRGVCRGDAYSITQFHSTRATPRIVFAVVRSAVLLVVPQVQQSVPCCVHSTQNRCAVFTPEGLSALLPNRLVDYLQLLRAHIAVLLMLRVVMKWHVVQNLSRNSLRPGAVYLVSLLRKFASTACFYSPRHPVLIVFFPPCWLACDFSGMLLPCVTYRRGRW